MNARCLVTSSSGLSNHALQLVDLRLGTTESTELVIQRQLLLDPHAVPEAGRKGGRTYPLLSQLTGTLVLAVAEEFDDTTLVWGKTIHTGPLATMAPLRGGWRGRTYPATSLTISRTKAVLLLRWPLVRETRGLTTRASVF
jgi:hypothetical protein